MAEKAASKKEQQQKNKKRKQQEKKKNQENVVKPINKAVITSPEKKTKNKNWGNKNNNHNNCGDNNVHKTPRKKSGSRSKSFIWLCFNRLIFILLALGFIYIVDFEKFVRIRDGAGYYVNKTVSLLPPEVVSKGKEAVEYFRPVAEITFHKGSAFINQTSTFLNTNPLFKEHWANIREISSTCTACLVDYMRTLYLQTIGVVMSLKKKLF